MYCCIKGCEKPAKVLGMCAAHYDRARTGRDMTKPVREVIRTGTDIERLKAKMKVDEVTGCWMWQKSVNTNGYGQFRFRGKPQQAHRVSWILHFGEIPNGSGTYGTKNVLHKCDTPLCINPDHLFLGDQADNANDAVSKERWGKRGLKGEKHGRATLTEEIVRAIRASDLTARQTAEKFGTSTGTVQHIKKRRTWAHIV